MDGGHHPAMSVGAATAVGEQAGAGGDGEVSAPQAKQWLADQDLLPELAEGQALTEDHICRRYQALSKC